ncbi:MAG: hypothetical protein JSR33_04585, partial [Proteobacteria bacterium]|nr:hypothetical protein [Pseudomonadota bacterium]
MDCQRHACVYVTQLESLQDVAEQFCPERKPAAINHYLKVMRLMNEFNQWWNPAYSQASDFPMLPHQCIYLPTAEDMQLYDNKIAGSRSLTNQWLISKEHWLDSIRRPNQEFFRTREVIAKLAEQRDLKTVSAVAWLLEGLRQLDEHEKATVAAGVGITFVEQVADYVKDSAKEIRTAMFETQEKLQAYQEAEHGWKTTAKQAYIEAHRELKHKFENYLKLHRSKPSGMRQLEFINNREKWL